MDLNAIIADLQAFLVDALAWIQSEVLTLATVLQLVAIVAVFYIARLAAKPIRTWLEEREAKNPYISRAQKATLPLILPAIWWVLQFILFTVAVSVEVQHYMLRVTLSLLGAWLVIRMLTAPLRNQSVSRMIAAVAWTIAALNIIGILNDTMVILDQAAVPLGDSGRISLLDIFAAILSLVVFVWVAMALSSLVEQRINQTATLNPSARVLLNKITRFALIALAIIVGIGAAGLDLTIFAVFGGALGLGVGFGLQKVVSNLFSGFILLMDRSIKPGDVIETQNTYGWINKLATRYTSIITRDGTEFLIPNEDMITQPVINWSHSDRLVRVKVDVGISYDSDLEKARELAVEAASSTKRVLESPSPRCLLMEFGDNSVNLQLRFWIEDPQNGVRNVSSDVRLKVWHLYHEHGVKFPFPQRDIHIIDAPDGLFAPKAE